MTWIYFGHLNQIEHVVKEANHINTINEWLRHLAHNYVLIVVAAILFFAVKAIIGFVTYKHYDKKLKILTDKVDRLLQENKRN